MVRNMNNLFIFSVLVIDNLLINRMYTINTYKCIKLSLNLTKLNKNN